MTTFAELDSRREARRRARRRMQWIDRACWLAAVALLSSFFWIPHFWP